MIGVSCVAPQSVVPGPAPTVLPPTSKLSVSATVTNCGTVAESRIAVTITAHTGRSCRGRQQPPAGARGGTRRTRVTLRSGGSVALAVGPFPVAGGHRYLVTVSIAIPPASRSNRRGRHSSSWSQITG